MIKVWSGRFKATIDMLIRGEISLFTSFWIDHVKSSIDSFPVIEFFLSCTSLSSECHHEI